MASEDNIYSVYKNILEQLGLKETVDIQTVEDCLSKRFDDNIYKLKHSSNLAESDEAVANLGKINCMSTYISKNREIIEKRLQKQYEEIMLEKLTEAVIDVSKNSKIIATVECAKKENRYVKFDYKNHHFKVLPIGIFKGSELNERLKRASKYVEKFKYADDALYLKAFCSDENCRTYRLDRISDISIGSRHYHDMFENFDY